MSRIQKRQSKRQPTRQARVPISVSLLHPDWVRTNRAASMKGQTMSEYCRSLIQRGNALVLDGEGDAALDPAA